MMRFRHPYAYPLLWLFFIAVTVLHEFGHALATRHYGGAVRRMGLALYLLAPAGFVDTSSAWQFRRRGERIVVSLAGMHIENYCVALLTAVAIFTPAGWVRDIAWIIAFMCTARILANLNPFLRLDGYWVLSDALGITNLRAKSFQQLLGRFPGFGRRFRPHQTSIPAEERSFLFVYGIAAVLNVVGGILVSGWLINLTLRNWLGAAAGPVSGAVTALIALLVVVGAWSYVKSLRSASADHRSA